MANFISSTFAEPHWQDIQTKSVIRAKMIHNYDDGSSRQFDCSISKPAVEGESNPDWDFIMDKYGEEFVTESTTEVIQKLRANQEKSRIEDDSRKKKEESFAKQEILFAIKLEAFEIEEIKNSKNRELKAKIRKSKSVTEVQAYTTILLMKEFENAKSEPAPTAKPATKKPSVKKEESSQE